MKKIAIIALVTVLISMMVLPVGAKTVSYAPYEGYEYNDYSESVAAPIGYIADEVYGTRELGLEIPLDDASDMVYKGDALYLLDGGNGRIIELDVQTMAVRKIYDSFVTADGDTKDISGAMGMALDLSGEHFYIANTNKYEVLKIDRQGTVVNVITRPDSALLDTDAQFLATKVTVDHKDRLYVLAESINLGAFVFTADGEFMHFFGSNPIVTTAEILSDYFWKQFMTKEQRKGLARITPTIFSNFDVDEYGFLYTVTGSTSTVAQSGLVRRLNYTGSDILNAELVFGDVEWDRVFGTGSLSTSFADVDIDSEGYINLLDEGRGRIFQYTTNGELIAAFGNYSEQQGGFSDPRAIESVGDKIYVLDAGKQSVIVFRPTEYGAALRNAFDMMDSTDTDQIYDAWMKVLQLNTNSQYPYYGIGTVYDTRGEYKEAMEYFKLAGAHEEYSKALQEYRKEYISENYLLIIAVAVVIVAVIVLVARFIKKRSVLVHGTAYSALETKWLFPIHTCLHPVDAFEQFKTRKIMSWRLSAAFVVLWFFASTVSYFYTGYSFNMNRAIDYQFLVTLFMSVGIYLLFVVANWSVCTLMNGKGSLKEIVATCAYSLIPYILSILIKTALSNVLTSGESMFLTIITTVGLLWTVLLLLIGLQSIHQYSFWGTIGSVLLTIFGMALIIFLLVLFFTLIQQGINAVQAVIDELQLR